MHTSTLRDNESMELAHWRTWSEGRERVRLVFANELTEADHVGRKDGGAAARGHSGRPAARNPSI
jgi:hypothetical protein